MQDAMFGAAWCWVNDWMAAPCSTLVGGLVVSCCFCEPLLFSPLWSICPAVLEESSVGFENPSVLGILDLEPTTPTWNLQYKNLVHHWSAFGPYLGEQWEMSIRVESFVPKPLEHVRILG